MIKEAAGFGINVLPPSMEFPVKEFSIKDEHTIYYGISNIGDYFDTNGIIIIDDKFEINDLTFDLYQDKIESIKKNLALSIDLLLAEDYIYLNYIKNYEKH